MAAQAAGDSQGSRSSRYSHKYVEYLYQWDATRRLKKNVAGPKEGVVDAHAINGVPVMRRGRGVRPADNKEAPFRVHAKRHVPNMSYASTEGLLDLSRPQTADAAASHLHIDELRTKNVRARPSGRHNVSSLAGPGALVTLEAQPVSRPKRGAGAANPALLTTAMARTLAHGQGGQEEEESALQRRMRLLWAVAAPPSEDSILYHSMSEAELQQAPKFDEAQEPAPQRHTCRDDERHAAFFDGLCAMTRNKVRGDFGCARTRSAGASTGLRRLAGLAS